MAQGTTDVDTPPAGTVWSAAADMQIYIPQSADPITYSIDLREACDSAEALENTAYLIDWTLPRPTGTSRGWAAYMPGHFYRYRDQRLQEYHQDATPEVFEPARNGMTRSRGVHREAQFADLLPSSIRAKMAAMGADTTYIVTTPRPGLTRYRRRIDGLDTEEGEYAFTATGQPSHIDIVTSPGTISEQTITVTYHYADTAAPVALTEEGLIAMYPADFEQYRQSNFTIDRLPGQPLPQFTAPTPTGERYTHHRGEAMRAPTVIALLDPAVGSTADVIAQLRQAQGALPLDTDLILAFVTNNIDQIDALAGPCGQQERILLGARALARDTGASTLPVVILADSQGNVADVITAYNPRLADIVIQKIALIH